MSSWSILLLKYSKLIQSIGNHYTSYSGSNSVLTVYAKELKIQRKQNLNVIYNEFFENILSDEMFVEMITKYEDRLQSFFIEATRDL